MTAWTATETALLLELRAGGVSLNDCARRLNRTKNACKCCLARLAGKSSRYEPVQKRRKTRTFTGADIARIRKLLEVHSIADTARIVGCAPQSIRALRDRGWTSISGSPLRPRPTDFALYANSMNAVQLSRHYRTGVATVARWIREYGERHYAGRKSGARAMPVPDDFAGVFPHLSLPLLAKRYGVCTGTIGRWRRQCGLPSKWPRKRLLREQAKHAKAVSWVEQFVQSEEYRRAA